MSTEEKLRIAGKDFVLMMLAIRKAQDEIYQERRLIEYILTGKGFAGLTKENEALASLFMKQIKMQAGIELVGLSRALDNKIFRLRFYKDWHSLSKVESIQELRQITAGWGPKRRGEALERWIILFKKRNTQIPKVAFKAEDELIQGLEIDLGKIQREADLYRIRSGTMWEDKHYLEGTTVDKDQLKAYTEVLNMELNVYAEELNESIEPKRLCYLFSTQQAAEKNFSYIQKQLNSAESLHEYADGTKATVNVTTQLREGKSVKVFYLDDNGLLRKQGEVIGK